MIIKLEQQITDPSEFFEHVSKVLRDDNIEKMITIHIDNESRVFINSTLSKNSEVLWFLEAAKIELFRKPAGAVYK